MNLSLLILAVCGSVVLLLVAADRHLTDSRNITRLAEHFGWTRSDAAEVYAMARQIGFGAAYQAAHGGPRQLPV